MSRPPLPPFTAETAAQKVRMAEDAWNTRDPARVALAYTTDSRWRNRSEFLEGRAAIEAFRSRFPRQAIGRVRREGEHGLHGGPQAGRAGHWRPHGPHSTQRSGQERS